MARVLALVPDILFGSRIQAQLAAAGHSVEFLPAAGALRQRLAEGADVLVVDLTDASLQGARVVEALRREGALAGVTVVGFYAHVDVQARERAQRAGFQLVVPRSRMAREAGELVARAADMA
jgi:CheY-like chemotaxis protein